MKANFLYFLVFALLFSCSDDFLDLAPKDQASISIFYETQDDFEVALIGAYGSFMGGRWADNLVYLLELRSDNATAVGTRNNLEQISNFNAQANNGNVTSFYQNSYQAIQASNAIITRIQSKGFPAEDKNRIEGQAKFIRAMAYYYLTVIYGDVPLILVETSGENVAEIRDLGRTPVSEVHSQIIQDLMDAEEMIQGVESVNLASSEAASALLGKVYMFQNDFLNASTQFERVINSGRFELESQYTDLFAVGNAQNSESIFVLEHVGSANGTGSALGFQMAPGGSMLGSFTIPNQGFYAEPNLNSTYQVNDSLRRDASAEELFKPGDEFGSDTIYLSRKYFDDNPFEQNNASNNLYILRYGDILLMQAEALNEINYVADGPAFNYLNAIRTRADIGVLTSADLPNQSAFRDMVLLERRLELAMECNRWIDLLRTGRAIETIGFIDENDLLFPIPETEILNNPDVIIQNPGY